MKNSWAVIVCTVMFVAFTVKGQEKTLTITSAEELFHLNPYTSFLKDSTENLSLQNILNGDRHFKPLNSSLYYFSHDKGNRVYWFKCSIDNQTNNKLRYYFYFLNGLDTVELFHLKDSIIVSQGKASALQSTASKPLFISQEMVLPVEIQTGLNHFYFKIHNESVWSQQRGGFLLNLAEEISFVNYFLEYRHYHGIALGMLLVMFVFHWCIYLFFKDKTYLLFMINLGITTLYLILMKHYHEEVLFLEPLLPVLRYVQDPLGVLISITAILFSQSFLNSKHEDKIMHGVMNGLMIILGCVALCMVLLINLSLMNQLSMFLGIITAICVIVASIRSLLRKNRLALYLLIGFLFIFFVPIMYILQFLGKFPFKSTASDFHYFGEAFRSIIFAVGIADRFYQIKKEALTKELEKAIALRMEKERISRDLHDNIGAQLIHMSMSLDGMIGKSDNEIKPVLGGLKNRMLETIQQLRDTIWVINKNEVTYKELEEKLTTLLWHCRQTHPGISFNLTIDQCLHHQKLLPNHAINIHRIIQEAITNSLKHSKATNITISIYKSKRQVIVNVKDNGVGFSVESHQLRDHYGLENMRKRAEVQNGILQIRSEVGMGTEIEVTLELELTMVKEL